MVSVELPLTSSTLAISQYETDQVFPNSVLDVQVSQLQLKLNSTLMANGKSREDSGEEKLSTFRAAKQSCAISNLPIFPAHLSQHMEGLILNTWTGSGVLGVEKKTRTTGLDDSQHASWLRIRSRTISHCGPIKIIVLYPVWRSGNSNHIWIPLKYLIYPISIIPVILCLHYSMPPEPLVSNYYREPGAAELIALYIKFPPLIIIIPGTSWNIPETRQESARHLIQHVVMEISDPEHEKGIWDSANSVNLFGFIAGLSFVVSQLSEETPSFMWFWRGLISCFPRARLPGESPVPPTPKNSCAVMSLLYRAPCWTHS